MNKGLSWESELKPGWFPGPQPALLASICTAMERERQGGEGPGERQWQGMGEVIAQRTSYEGHRNPADLGSSSSSASHHLHVLGKSPLLSKPSDAEAMVRSRAHGKSPLKTLPATEVREVGRQGNEPSSLGKDTDRERARKPPSHPTHSREP